MPFQVTGIDHVQIAVPKALEAECLAFYRAVLRLSEIPKPEELRGRGGAWFQIGTLQLHIGLDPEPSPPSKRHVCLLVDDLPRAKAEIVAPGARIEEEGEAEGLRRFFIRDPAGNRLELAERVRPA
jgi:catechol 2,3-dioxygenase-like lactoylglutathione lyase family enzyme